MSGRDNLTPWKKGVSGNPHGRPKGSKNLGSTVRELLEDENLYATLKQKRLIKSAGGSASTTADAIIIALAIKAANGDVQSAEWLRKTGYADEQPQAVQDAPVALVRFVGDD